MKLRGANPDQVNTVLESQTLSLGHNGHVLKFKIPIVSIGILSIIFKGIYSFISFIYDP